MKVVLMTAPDGPDVLQAADVAKPRAGPNAPAAHKLVEGGHMTGKLVLQIE